ncbi:MAG: DNA repair protein RecN [Desulfobulbaceae bacterium]|nr:DNA repair protein RecN [Desulfobulbaceae bacterium]
MLQELRIDNLALIDRLNLEFSEESAGLVVFTGETGAGKSILLQAINLLTGGRAQASWIRSDCDQAVIEALFELRNDNPELRTLLSQHDLAEGDDCIIRRVVRKGKSRIYVNDRLITVRLAEKLAENLVNIASQHDHQQLLATKRHLDFLDSYGELWAEREEYRQLYNGWKKCESKLRELQEKELDKERRLEQLTYQIKEIRDADITVGEDEELMRARDRLKSSGELASLADKSYSALGKGMVDRMNEARKNMAQAAVLDPEVEGLAERLAAACYEVEDLEATLRDYRDSIPMDLSSLQKMNDRLALFKQLQRKYGITLEEVLEFAAEAERELESLEDMEREISRLEKQYNGLLGELKGKAKELSDKRQLAGQQLGAAMEGELVSLSFPEPIFAVSFGEGVDIDVGSMTPHGADQVEFLFSANPGEPPKALADIASGGELSRLTLAMKCLLAKRDQTETVIFDEIDSGLGGKAAEAIANKIRKLAYHHQVICVTHLPQIAAHADEHFLVAKRVDEGRTRTTINPLDHEQRVLELARMLGGESLTEQTLAYSRELLERSERKDDKK